MTYTPVSSQTYVPTIGDGQNNFVSSDAVGFYSVNAGGTEVTVSVIIVYTSKGSANSVLPIQISLPRSVGVESGASFTLGATGFGMLGGTPEQKYLVSANFNGSACFLSDGATAVTVGDVLAASSIHISGRYFL